MTFTAGFLAAFALTLYILPQLVLIYQNHRKPKETKTETRNNSTSISPGWLTWIGGAVYVANQPGYGFWDGFFWMYYVGRYIAVHYALLVSP